MDKACNNPFGDRPSGLISDEDFDRWFETLPPETLQVVISRCQAFGEPQVQNEVRTLYMLEKAKAVMSAIKDGRIKTLSQRQVWKLLDLDEEREPAEVKKPLSLPEGVTIKPLVDPDIDLDPLIESLPQERQDLIRAPMANSADSGTQ